MYSYDRRVAVARDLILKGERFRVLEGNSQAMTVKDGNGRSFYAYFYSASGRLTPFHQASRVTLDPLDHGEPKRIPISEVEVRGPHGRWTSEGGSIFREARAVRPNYGVDHFLVEADGWYHIIRLQRSGDKPIACVVAETKIKPAGCAGAMSVDIVAAEKGYGPAIYDAAMELVYPQGLTSAVGSTSSKATKVWDYYLHNRSDVDHEPKPEGSRCAIKGHESLDQIYFKRPGKAAGSLIGVQAFNRHPRVVVHFGEPQNVKNPRMDLYDCTQAIQWA